MFCPNCGKDCGSARFCASCGTKVQQVVESVSQPSEWKTGMPCPHCGGTQLNGNHCAFCGGQLIVDEPTKVVVDKTNLDDEDSYEIPYRHYRAVSKTLHMAKDGLLIEEDALFSKKQTRIAYDQLTSIEFKRNENEFGSLQFMYSTDGEDVKRIFMPCGREDRCTEFYHVFQLLREVTPPHVEFLTVFPESDRVILDRYFSKINFDFYFYGHNPYRNRAMSAIRKDHALDEDEARRLIDALFNEWQRKLYEENPKLAIRDMNRYWKERNRLFEEDERECDERQAARRRNR